jgi:regulator of protease activity HflC (stomatin/prohibitin superfamily)
MGKFHRILEPGLAILIPFIDRIAYVKSLKESAIEIPSQNAITADNVTLELDGVLYTRVFDAYKARYAGFRLSFFCLASPKLTLMSL